MEKDNLVKRDLSNHTSTPHVNNQNSPQVIPINLLHSKILVFIIAIMILSTLTVLIFVYKPFQKQEKLQSQNQKINQTAQNPVQKLPETNPFETKTNPFKDVKTNPFD